MKTEVAELVLKAARIVLRNEAGRTYPPETIEWAEAIVRGNRLPPPDSVPPVRAFSLEQR